MHALLLDERDRFAASEPGGFDVFDRLALLIYGVRLGSVWSSQPPRRDGVIRGTDFLLASSEVTDTADDDARRIALFDSALSPYWLDGDGSVRLGDHPTGLRLDPFPYKTYLGRPFSYYLRSDRDGQYTRLVLNPHANCYSRCKWCARTYDSQSRPDQIAVDPASGLSLEPRALRELPRLVTPVDELLGFILRDPAVVNGARALEHLTEVAILSGDFPRDSDVVPYLTKLLTALRTAGFCGRFYYAGHQIERASDMQLIAEMGLRTRFVYTIEHFTRRPELMPVKGRRSIGDIIQILKTACRIFGRENVFYYLIIGIDPIHDLRENLARLQDIATPQAFVLTPYNFVHAKIYQEESQLGRLRLLLRARRLMLDLYGHPIAGGSNRSLFPLTSDDPIEEKTVLAQAAAPASAAQVI